MRLIPWRALALEVEVAGQGVYARGHGCVFSGGKILIEACLVMCMTVGRYGVLLWSWSGEALGGGTDSTLDLCVHGGDDRFDIAQFGTYRPIPSQYTRTVVSGPLFDRSALCSRRFVPDSLGMCQYMLFCLCQRTASLPVIA